jgi:hypothetical protein
MTIALFGTRRLRLLKHIACARSTRTMSRRLSSQLVKRSITASDVLRSIRAVMKYDEDACEAGERSWMMWASGASVTESDYSTSSGQSRA